MSMGAYDEDEHERREAMASKVDADFDDKRINYQGKVNYDSGDDTQALIDQFKQIKSGR
ncbi:DUF5786 family protein [Natronomonas sp. EA1]|uniref:DUF5786 family protein n=1 Tax=Natronomonas sp. EA1 TaxID=3421655 RepID=UPI003EB70585